jgi:hypothetical protein
MNRMSVAICSILGKQIHTDVLFCQFLVLLSVEVGASVSSSVPDPHVFGPPGSEFISQRYGSGSGSFYHQAKIVRKTLILTVL